MAQQKPLTKTDLVKALKETGVAIKNDVKKIVSREINSNNLATKKDLKQFATKDDLKQFATKDDVKNLVGGEIESRGVATKNDIFKTVSEASEAILDGMDKMFSERDKRFDELESKIEVGNTNLQRQIDDLKWDTPTKKAFRKLKQRVDYHHPVN